MSVVSVFLIGMKSLIVLIPLLIIIRLGITNSMISNTSNFCDKESNIKFEHCANKLLEFGNDYRNWESTNFPSQDLPIIMKLKVQCEQVPKCFKSLSPNCRNEFPMIENFPVWCRRIYLFSGDFSKCSGKINQIAGSSKCAKEFFGVDFIEKPKDVKCEIMKNDKECILESVQKTCANKMSDVLKMVFF
uniref:DUF19 domain-containing protein n=2 Tax=Caenorhabditis tropicalis TaxID=1561998 RepID=A0A1I7UWE0_9PELO